MLGADDRFDNGAGRGRADRLRRLQCHAPETAKRVAVVIEATGSRAVDMGIIGGLRAARIAVRVFILLVRMRRSLCS